MAITAAERESLLKNLAESRERLVSAVRSLTREQRHHKTAPDRWSYAEIVEHLIAVENRVLELIQKSLEAGPDHAKRAAKEDGELFSDIAGRVTRFNAPPFLVPTGKVKDDDLLRAFEAARERTTEFARATESDLRRHFAPHPIFGEMDCYQWLMLVTAHCDRHRVQGEEVKAHPSFPRAAAAR